MNINIGVVTGTGKADCEDSAFINDSLVNDNKLEHSAEKLLCIGIADGVGGNAGGKMAI